MSTRELDTTGWKKILRVTGDGTGSGIVSHAGVALLRALADKTGLTAGLSRALASRRLVVHDGVGFWPTWPAGPPMARR